MELSKLKRCCSVTAFWGSVMELDEKFGLNVKVDSFRLDFRRLLG